MKEAIAVWSNAVGWGAAFAAVVTWLRRRRSVLMLLLVAVPAMAQSTPTPSFLPKAPGTVNLGFSITNPSGRVVTVLKTFTVYSADVVTLEIFTAFLPPRFVGQGTVGRPLCQFAQGKDSLGNVITGRKWIATTSDTTTLNIVAVSSICPDTTIDASKMIVNPLPPINEP